MFRILLLEDEPHTRTLLREVLERLPGCVVMEASSVKKALEMAGKNRFHFMLLDQHLRDGSALDFCRGLPAALKEIEKWVLTGEKPLEWDAELWSAFGVQGYLLKPCPLERLTEIISQCLESPRA